MCSAFSTASTGCRTCRSRWKPSQKTGAICEAAICYTGDILNPKRTKYDLKYYVNLAKELEKMGAHILAIKDMAGLVQALRGGACSSKTLKQEIGIPIHFHTHDTAGIQAASILKPPKSASTSPTRAMAPMSGGTSQPNLNTLGRSAAVLTARARASIRQRSTSSPSTGGTSASSTPPFESDMLAGAADLYQHEMPGGQYTNLFQQAQALGLADRWTEVCRMYAEVNQLFGDIVKVTPTSKAVGDMALFMVANDLTLRRRLMAAIANWRSRIGAST